MSDIPHFAELLHLGTLAVAVPGTYLGIDRIRPERDDLRDKLQSIGMEVESLLLGEMEFREKNGRFKTSRAFRRMPQIAVLCYVAQRRLKLGWYRPIGFAWCLWYAPLLSFYRRGLHIFAVAAALLVSIVMFVYVNAVSVWREGIRPAWLHSCSELLTPESCFFYFSGIILFVFLISALSMRLRSIEEICEKLMEDVRLEKAEFAKEIRGGLDGD